MLTAALHSGPQTSPLGRQSRSMCMIAGKDELLGPKINGNPERFEHYILIRHECAEQLTDTPRDLDSLAAYLHARPYEGIVWHHPDGRMAKLKKRDFPA